MPKYTATIQFEVEANNQEGAISEATQKLIDLVDNTTEQWNATNVDFIYDFLTVEEIQ